jgi:NADP-dependent 3-hydroxy acid dehydrogenase YdfG
MKCFVEFFAILTKGVLILPQSISPGAVNTEIAEGAGYPEEELEIFKTYRILEASDIADSVIYVLGTPPHVQVSIKCRAIPVTLCAGPQDYETLRHPIFL